MHRCNAAASSTAAQGIEAPPPCERRAESLTRRAVPGTAWYYLTYSGALHHFFRPTPLQRYSSQPHHTQPLPSHSLPTPPRWRAWKAWGPSQGPWKAGGPVPAWKAARRTAGKRYALHLSLPPTCIPHAHKRSQNALLTLSNKKGHPIHHRMALRSSTGLPEAQETSIRTTSPLPLVPYSLSASINTHLPPMIA